MPARRPRYAVDEGQPTGIDRDVARPCAVRRACSARSDRPISSLVEAGRGGLPQDPDATLPALYIAGRDVNPDAQTGADTAEANSALQTTVRLTMRCS